MRYLRYAILAILTLALLAVAVANRAPVEVKALPDGLAALFGVSWSVQVPLFLVLFGGAVAGLMIGFLWEWLREHKHRKAASTRSREVTRLERELAVMRDSASVPAQDDVIALLDRKAG
ncbi:MAG: LapA family protein [Paracoccaceae bacterium]